MSKFSKSLFILIGILILLLVGGFTLYRDAIWIYQNVGSSMAPTIMNNDKVVVNKYAYKFEDIKLWDLVLVTTQDKNFIRRVIGLPWEKIKIEKGVVYVQKDFSRDFVELAEDYVADFNRGKTFLPIDVAKKEFIIPQGEYFLLGDNRNNSTDSRSCFSSCTLSGASHFVKISDIVWRIDEVVKEDVN